MALSESEKVVLIHCIMNSSTNLKDSIDYFQPDYLYLITPTYYRDDKPDYAYYSITNKEIDDLYKKLKKKGASTAKICGAGGGGFMFVIFSKKDFFTKIQKYNYYQIKSWPKGSEVIYSQKLFVHLLVLFQYPLQRRFPL